MNQAKNIDFLGALVALLVLAGNRGSILYGPGALLSQDLEIALSAYFLAALARWRLRVSRSNEEPSEAPPAPDPLEEEESD